MEFTSAAFWLALGSIVLTNVVLSGDNAVVIALAARALPKPQQRQAIVWGSAAAIVLRVLLTLAAVKLLQLPYLKLAGAVLLFYIGTQLLAEEEDELEQGRPIEPRGLLSAVRTILVADLVMSLDNVLAVAAAAQGSVPLLVIGLGLSIPLIVFGSTLLLKLMERLPVIITLGGALLGWLAGAMLVSDPVVPRWFATVPPSAEFIAGTLGALGVVALGSWLAARARRSRPPHRSL